MTTDIETLVSEAIGLLKSLIAIPSLSREEEQAADFLQNYIEMQGMATGRKGNNIWCLSPMFDLNKPTLLLNSHIDTVKPVNGWRKAPFTPTEENGKIYGLGSNDAGASVVSLPDYTGLQPDLPGFLRGRGVGQGRSRVRTAGAAAHTIRHCGRTHGDATRHCRKRADGTGCHRLRQVGACCPERRRQRHIQGAERHCLVPRLPFPERIGFIGAGKNECNHGECRDTAQCNTRPLHIRSRHPQ